jgi:hypothetical protein
MATLTLNYNVRNVQAQNLINYILATGLVKPQIAKSSSLANAFDDLEKGRVYHAITKAKK